MHSARVWKGLVVAALALLVLMAGMAQAMAQDDGAKGAGVSAADASGAPQGHDLKLRQLEEKVNHLKEKIFRSKARLMLLQETILHGVIAGSKAVIVHKNSMGSGYKLESVAYYLDGAPIFGKINLDGSLDSSRELTIYDGTIQPGNHLLSVYMVYRGSSALFVYVEGVQVKLKTSYTFKAEEGKVTRIKVEGYDKGGVLAKFEERPAIRYETSFADLQEKDLKNVGEQTDETEGTAASDR